MDSEIIEKTQLLLNFLDANPELKQKLNQHLDELNALKQSTETINNATLDSIEETYNKISSINETKFLREKYRHIKKTLNSNIKKLKGALRPNKKQQQIEPQQEQLSQLNSYLAKLFCQLSELNNPEFPFLQLKKIEENINASMNDINRTLKSIGLTELANFQADIFPNDYYFIHDSLDEIIAKAQDQKKIVKMELNQRKFKKESTEGILARYNIPEISLNNIMLKNENQITEINGDQYKEGQYYNDDNDSIDLTLMTLSNDNICYLDRILDVLTKIKDIEGVESIFGYNKEDGPSYTIITKSGGENLFTSLCPRNQQDDIKKLTSKDKTILACKIAKAMAKVHSKNVIHRILSTRFINFYYINDVIFPIITNFRYSRSQPNNSMEDLTCYKDMPLKISNFLAPEFYSGGNYNQSIDVFAFGVILYELFTESTPFEEYSANEIYKKLLENELPSFDKFNGNEDLANLIKKCWKIKPEDRPTFNDILYELREKKMIIQQNVNDAKEKNAIDNFYTTFKVDKNPKFKDCLDCIETIKDDISKSVHFSNQFHSTALFLKFYLNCLKNHQPEDNNNSTYQELYHYLVQYKELINKYGPEIVPETSSKFIEINIAVIPNEIEKIINNIDDTMRGIGYGNSERYAQSIDDIIFDFHVLYLAFLGDKNPFSDDVIKVKYDEIKEYITKKYSDRALRSTYLNSITGHKFNKEFIYNKICDNLGSLSFNKKDLDQTIEYYDEISEKEGEDNFEPIIRLNLEGFKVLYQSRSSLVYTKDIGDNNYPYAYKVFHGKYLSLRKENLMLLKKEIEFNTLVKNKYIAEFQKFSIKNLKNDCYVILVTKCGQKGTLRQIMDDKNNKLTDFQKTTIVAKIASAMRYLSENNISHHDLTPENIVIDSNFDPKIIDFGQATLGSQDLIGVTDGTSENPILDNRDDLFSFSKILYEMYTGEKIQNVRNFKFEKDEDAKKDPKRSPDLEFLIELGFRTDEKTSFEKIYNLLVNRNIAFPEANNEEVDNFYKRLSSEVLSP